MNKIFTWKLLAALLFFSIFVSCGNRDRTHKNNEAANTEASDANKSQSGKIEKIAPKINVFIENSLSMTGYIQGNTEFKGALANLLVELKYLYTEDSITLYFINEKTDRIPKTIEEFITELNINSFGALTSDLNIIFKQILEKTDKNSISILVSDCIYSVKGSGPCQNTLECLNEEKTLTKNAFLEKSRSGIPLQTTIIQLSSTFSGYYYDNKDRPWQMSNVKRPYYFCSIGSTELIDDFNKKIDLKKLDGYQNIIISSSKNFTQITPSYSVLTASYNIGRFKASRDYTVNNAVHGIEDVEISRREEKMFEFAIAVDMSKYPIDEKYILDTSNYRISEGQYKIKAILPIEKKKIHASDWRLVDTTNATHVIIFQSLSNVFADLSFSLNKNIPKWVSETSIIDDTDTTLIDNKTFALEYLIKGIVEANAMISQNDKYFEIKVSVTKSSGSNAGSIIIGILSILTIGAIIYLFVKHKKQQ